MSAGHPDRQRSPRREGVCEDVRASQELGDVQRLLRDLGSRMDKSLRKQRQWVCDSPRTTRTGCTTQRSGQVCVPKGNSS